MDDEKLFPTIVRVRNYREARYEADLRGLRPSRWKYLAAAEQVKGIEFKPGITYYIHIDVPHFEIGLRMR